MIIPASLRRWELLSHFQDAELKALAKCLSRHRVKAGTRVVREGDATLDAYLIEDGRVKIQRETPYGCCDLAILDPGDLFGEASFIDGGPRSGDALAVTDSDLVAFDPDSVSALITGDQRASLALYWSFWKSLSRKLRRSNEALTRFFTETGTTPTSEPPQPMPATGEFRVELADKRKVFQEQRLSPMEINFLTSLSREKKLQPGQVIFREGEPGDRMYVVLEGKVRISKYIAGAGEEALAILERGDYFGEMALIDEQPRSADARAHDQGAVVLAIPRDVLRGILDIRKVSSLSLLKVLCSLVSKRLRELDDKIVGWYVLSGGADNPPPPLNEEL